MGGGFFKELRRRSRASIRTERSTDHVAQVNPANQANQVERVGERYHTDSSSNASQGTGPTTGSVTPPSNHGSDPALDRHLKEMSLQQHASSTPSLPRPPPQPLANTNRHSMSGMSGLGGSPVLNGRANLPVSPYAPRILNAIDGTHAYQKNMILHGTIGDPSQHTVDGEVHVSRLDHQFPMTQWAVYESHWKAMVHLQPGINKLRIDFSSPKLANNGSSNNIHSTYLDVFMVPPQNTPPLQLAIVLGKDSPETFDAIPARTQVEGNGLDTAIRKYRMAAYLWQAFTGEQMARNRMGRRSFSLEDEWITGTSHSSDRFEGKMRSEARVHVIRSDKTVAELQELARLEYSTNPKHTTGLFDTVADDLNAYFGLLPGQKKYVSVLLMDAHWDVGSKTVLGHAAKGGRSGDLHLSMFGSHYLQSYPSSIDEVRSAFEDCSRLSAEFAAHDGNGTASSWEVANAGIGGHLRQIGYMFGCPRQETGIMGDDYPTISRSFSSREPFSTRTKSKGGLVQPKDECAWHILDCLRFRWHPCFRLPNDFVIFPDASVQAFPVDGNNVVLTAKTGISHIEILGENDDFCRSWMRFGVERGLPKQISLSEQEIKDRLPEAQRKGLIRMRVLSGAGGTLYLDDVRKLYSKESSFKFSPGPLGKSVFRGKQLGRPESESVGQTEEFLFTSAIKRDRVLLRVIVYHNPSTVFGIEFIYDDNSSQLLGGKGDSQSADVFELDLRRGEYIAGFTARVGDGIKGISISTSLGQSSPYYGDSVGGEMHTLLPPRGYTVCGVTGSYGTRLASFGVLTIR